MAKQRISFGSQYKFPLKLYQVVNDGLLIKWTEDGMAIVVEQKEFEDNVMQLYPGFVQVKTFHNLRRLFRDYTFKCQVLRRKKPYGFKLEFRHQFFTRENPQQILLVRKTRRRYSLYALATSSPKNNLVTIASPCSKLAVHNFGGFDSIGSISCVSDEFDSPRQLFPDCSTPELSWRFRDFMLNSTPTAQLNKYNLGRTLTTYSVDEAPSNLFSSNTQQKFAPRNNELSKEDMDILEQIFAKNEMSESEFWQVVTRNRGIEWKDKSWEATMQLLTKVANPELSPLHHKGVYYEFSFDEL